MAIWTDVSGNGFNAIQTVTSNQPTFVTGALNGEPVDVITEITVNFVLN